MCVFHWCLEEVKVMVTYGSIRPSLSICFNLLSQESSIFIYIYIYITHTHTHTHLSLILGKSKGDGDIQIHMSNSFYLFQFTFTRIINIIYIYIYIHWYLVEVVVMVTYGSIHPTCLNLLSQESQCFLFFKFLENFQFKEYCF